MAGIKALRKIQLGREVAAGTAVAATAIWRGMGTLEDTREVVFPEEDVGIFPGTDRMYAPKLGGQLEMEAVPLTFEQVFHILEAGVLTVGTGVADGAGSGKIYNYTFPETAANTIKTYTIEGGDNQEAEEMEYSFVSEFELAGKGGEAWTMAATWMGRQVTVSSFTGALTIPTVEEALFSKTLLYIDVIGGTYGTTVKSDTLLGASLKVTTGWVPVWTGVGAAYFGFAKQTPPEITLEITFEHDGTSAAEKVFWRAGTARKLQLKCVGSALATPGTAYTYKSLIVNLCGKWEKFNKIDEMDGNDIISSTFRGRYNSTAADAGNIIVVNEVATVP